MKNKGFIFLIAIIAIIGCLFLVGCNEDGDDDSNNPFKGTWVGTDGGGGASKAIFGDSTYEGEGTGWKSKGTYTFNGNVAQMTQTHMDVGSGWTTQGMPMNLTATITGNVMTIPSQGTTSTYTKQ